MSDYAEFLRSKDRTFIGVGLPTTPDDLPTALFAAVAVAWLESLDGGDP